jgi:putative ATP-dependent endonuclease of OLD family
LDVLLSEHAVIVGENKIGKSNFLHALRLVLDPSLPDSARQLRDEDFWDGLTRPLARDEKITVAVDLTDYEDDADLLAVLAEHVISTEPMVSRLTYEFGVPASGQFGDRQRSLEGKIHRLSPNCAGCHAVSCETGGWQAAKRSCFPRVSQVY